VVSDPTRIGPPATSSTPRTFTSGSPIARPNTGALAQPDVAWHSTQVTNGPTEPMNNLIKRVKRVAFSFTSFRKFQIGVLLYAGKPKLVATSDDHTPLKSEEL
jgi:hypothetical protein